jgi:colicin import membrane protein
MVRLISGAALALMLSVAAFGADKPAQPNCCVKKAACCKAAKPCCGQHKKADCCKKKAACCDAKKACCSPKRRAG